MSTLDRYLGEVAEQLGVELDEWVGSVIDPGENLALLTITDYFIPLRAKRVG